MMKCIDCGVLLSCPDDPKAEWVVCASCSGIGSTVKKLRGKTLGERIEEECAAMHAAMDRKEAEMDKFGYGGKPSGLTPGIASGLALAESGPLPRIRAGELQDLYDNAMEAARRPPREDYVRVTREAFGYTLEPAIEYRDGDDFRLLAGQLMHFSIDASLVGYEDHMKCARDLAVRIEKHWPDRAYFVEVWQEGREGFAQIFQPYGVPRNR